MSNFDRSGTVVESLLLGEVGARTCPSPSWQVGQFVSGSNRAIREFFRMPSGNKSLHENLANEMTLAFRNDAAQTMQVVIRDDHATLLVVL